MPKNPISRNNSEDGTYKKDERKGTEIPRSILVYMRARRSIYEHVYVYWLNYSRKLRRWVEGENSEPPSASPMRLELRLLTTGVAVLLPNFNRVKCAGEQR